MSGFLLSLFGIEQQSEVFLNIIFSKNVGIIIMQKSRIYIVTMALATVQVSKPMDLSRLNPRILAASVIGGVAPAAIMPTPSAGFAEAPVQQVVPQTPEPVHEGTQAMQIGLADMPDFVRDGELCRYLPLRDIVSLRQTCRALRNAWDHERLLRISESHGGISANDKSDKKPISAVLKGGLRVSPDTLAHCRNKLEMYVDFTSKGLPENFSEEIQKLPRLQQLCLHGWQSSERLEEMLARLYFLPNLEELDVSSILLLSKSLVSVPEALQRSGNLRKLNLSGNRILAKNLANLCLWLPKLQDLDLGDNHLTTFPRTIKNLVNLRKLNLQLNEISPGALAYLCTWLTQLHDLDLGGNRLTALPEAIRNLVNLKKLNLPFNRITTEAVEHLCTWLPNLEELDLKGNRLAVLPEAISRLRNLRRLDLQENRLGRAAQETIKSWLPHTDILF